LQRPRGKIRRGLFVGKSRSDGGAHVRTPHPSSRVVASASPSEPSPTAFIHWPARANVPAGGALAASASGPPERIGFAPETIAPTAICRALYSRKREQCMTAYLISLALAGLVAIAVWDGLS